MKNLENYGVQEMNATEIAIFEGGTNTYLGGCNYSGGGSQYLGAAGTGDGSCIVCDSASFYADEGGWGSLGLMFAHALGLHN